MERFTVEVPEATLGDLAERLARARWPGALNGSGWEDGTSPAFLRELVGWWQTGFDWRAHEAAINRYAHFRATVDGVGAAPRVAELWAELMTDVLGYERFGAHGGDIGAMVANRLALEHPERLAGIHVTGTADPYVGPGAAPLTPGEQAMLSARAHWHEVEGGYVHLQRTRPQTLAYGLADSPVGLAAWILEKWRAWSDGDLERPVHQGPADHHRDAVLGDGNHQLLVPVPPGLGAGRGLASRGPRRGLGGSDRGARRGGTAAGPRRAHRCASRGGVVRLPLTPGVGRAGLQRVVAGQVGQVR
ncbi:MAG: Epoxide hydrolase domain protein [Actinomycetia bacterium]|nr:Epoxide hydrolase domain protein [Actinomycetes bacterium]